MNDFRSFRGFGGRQNQNDLDAYINAIKTRPSTTAAKEFFSDGGTRDWWSLPQRCERLVHVLDEWVSDQRHWQGRKTTEYRYPYVQ